MLDCLCLLGAWRWHPPELRRLGRDTLLERSLSFATLRPGLSTGELDLSGLSNRGFHIGWANLPTVWTAGDSEADVSEADYEKALTGIELAPLYGRHSMTMTKLKHLMDACGIQQREALQVLSHFERERDGARLWAKLCSITATSTYSDFQRLNRMLSGQRGLPVPLTIHASGQQQQQTSTTSFEFHPGAGGWSSIASDTCRIDTAPAHVHNLNGEGKRQYLIVNIVIGDHQQNLMPFATVRDASTHRCTSFVRAKDVQQGSFWLLINLNEDEVEDETGETDVPWVYEAKLSCLDTAFTLAEVEVLSWPDSDGEMVCKIVEDSTVAGEICVRA